MDYKKILEGVVDIINTAEKSDIGFANICTYIGENCPELAESEDERIKKSLIHLVHLYGGEFGMIDANTSVEKAIAWLEKQGEQKHADSHCLDCTNAKGCVNCTDGDMKETRKPVWSEEDKKHIIDIIDYLDDYYSFAKDEYEDVADGVQNEIRWLQRIQKRL